MDNQIKTNLIVNGYWYYFHYINDKEMIKGYDEFPFIFCIEPVAAKNDNDLNSFWAINLHHLPYNERVEFIIKFDQMTNFLDGDSREIITCNYLVNQIYPSCQKAIRRYNKKHIWNPYRVPGQKVPFFIDYDGKIIMSSPNEIINKYMREKSASRTTTARNK